MVSVSTIHVHAVSECVHRQALCTLGEVAVPKDTHDYFSKSDRIDRIISLANLANVLTFYVSSDLPDLHLGRASNTT